MKAFLKKALVYFDYPSTYKGLIVLLTGLGLKISPDQATAISTAGIALYGVISVFFSDADVAKPSA